MWQHASLAAIALLLLWACLLYATKQLNGSPYLDLAGALQVAVPVDPGAWSPVREDKFLEVPQIVWGLNNQKIAFARAVLTARYLNRTLIMPMLSANIFDNATHPAKPFPFDGIFSFKGFNRKCQPYAAMIRRSDLPSNIESLEVLKGSGRRWSAARDLDHLEECKEPEFDKHPLLRIVGKNPFLWPDHWPVKDYVRVFECLSLSEGLLPAIEEIRSKLLQASMSVHSDPHMKVPSYIAVHMRIERDWMIHCENLERRSMLKYNKKLSICSNKKEIITRVHAISGIVKPALVYLAVADVLLEDSSILDGWGHDFIPIEKQQLKALNIYRKYPYIVQAAMDYEICVHATLFVGNTFSTFSSMVVLDRTIRMAKQRKLDVCKSSYAYNLVTKDGIPRQWASNISDKDLQAISYGTESVSCANGWQQ